MSNTKRLLAIAALAAGTVLTMSPSYAFNPQPDPPARLANKFVSNPGDKAFIGFDKGNAKGLSAAITSPGLLEGSAGFSAHGHTGAVMPHGLGAGRGAMR